MSDARKLDRPPTRADLDALPENVVGEIIDGVLYTQPRPRGRHGRAERSIAGTIGAHFDDANDGPSGWWIINEPGIELPDAPEIAPDIAGWRRERLPEVPDVDPIRIVPDWVCEILSTNRSYDLKVKRPFYARVGVPWMWLVDIAAKTIVVSQLEQGRWMETMIVGEDDHVVRIPPFESLEVDTRKWWKWR